MYGTRFDNDYATFPPTRVALAGYGIVDIAITFRASETFDLYTRIENLFDQEYEEVLGYGTMGCTAVGGIKMKL